MIIDKNTFEILHEELRNRYKDTDVIVTVSHITSQMVWCFDIYVKRNRRVCIDWFEKDMLNLTFPTKANSFNIYSNPNPNDDYAPEITDAMGTDTVGVRQKITEIINQIYMEFL